MKSKFLLIVLMMQSLSSLANTDTTVLLSKAQQGDPQAQFDLAKYYEFTKANNEALDFYIRSANQNNIQAINKIASAYKNGKLGLSKNTAQAIVWYKKSANLGDSNSFNEIGKIHESIKGLGVGNYKILARNAYVEGMNRHNPESAYRLGKLARELNQPELANDALFKAMKQNYPAAFSLMGDFNKEGFGREQNFETAEFFYKRGADLNDPASMHEYAKILIFNKNDLANGLPLLEKAAAQGYGRSYGLLGDLYHIQPEFPQLKDLTKAITYYTHGVRLNDAISAYNLAALYSANYSDPKEYNTAYYSNEINKLLEKAASLENPQALMYFGDKYMNIDNSKAISYYERAAKSGSEVAKMKLRSLGRNVK